jgi:hypothetical protein
MFKYSYIMLHALQIVYKFKRYIYDLEQIYFELLIAKMIFNHSGSFK